MRLLESIKFEMPGPFTKLPITALREELFEEEASIIPFSLPKFQAQGFCKQAVLKSVTFTSDRCFPESKCPSNESKFSSTRLQTT
jgi:hypothetical protein